MLPSHRTRAERAAGRAARLAVSIPFLAAVLAASPAHAQPRPETEAPLRVMSWDLGEGTDYQPLYFAIDAPGFAAGAGQVLREVRATRPHERMRAVAWQIARAAPALVSLHDVVRWSTGPMAGNMRCGPMKAEIDMLAALQRALRGLGTSYRVAAQVAQFSMPPLPADLGAGGWRCAQVLNRNVILARADLPPGRFGWSHPQSGRLDAPGDAPRAGAAGVAQLGVYPGGRAWVAVDAQVQGRWLRFMGAQMAHLDPFMPQERRQDGELLRALADASPLPVVLALAAHAHAVPPPPDDRYVDFLVAGYRDAWAQAVPGQPGATCCQAPSMDNEDVQLSRRTDLVWLRGAVQARAAAVVGGRPGDRTAGGLWPSDHAGVVVDLVLEAGP
ncbi:hypothetical protein [uncultured Azohydromonas sp.]|uniref:hypothetical protein n=1 Tax=uncultured Azohydromonas sp. TaxID=487342 RepID=UPI00261C2DF7|nr:hypothetical protein [uncultured Azohydromonas sp.]